MIDIRVSFDGTDLAVISGLEELVAGHEKQASRSLDEAAAAVLNNIRTHFLQEEDPYGTAWVESASARRRKAKGGTGTLFDSGKLFHSIQLARTGEMSREIGTDVEYGLDHQEGLNGNIKREFIAITPEDEARTLGIFQMRMQELFK